MDKERLNIIRAIRDEDFPLECDGCGYYDCDGDWHWYHSQNDCWNKYTTAQLRKFLTD